MARIPPDRYAAPVRQRPVTGGTPRCVVPAPPCSSPSIAVLTVLPLAAAPVLARDARRAEHDRTVAYWTTERIANAVPRDFAETPGSASSRRAEGKPTRAAGGDRQRHRRRWTKGGQVLRTTGKVVFTINSGNYICSGTVVTRRHDRSIDRADRGPLRVRRGGRRVRHELDVHPRVRRDADLHLLRNRSGAAGRPSALVVNRASRRPAASTTRPSSTTGRSRRHGRRHRGDAQLDDRGRQLSTRHDDDGHGRQGLRLRLSGRRQVPRQRPDLLRRPGLHRPAHREPDVGASTAT